jgi:hypothetical protein
MQKITRKKEAMTFVVKEFHIKFWISARKDVHLRLTEHVTARDGRDIYLVEQRFTLPITVFSKWKILREKWFHKAFAVTQFFRTGTFRSPSLVCHFLCLKGRRIQRNNFLTLHRVTTIRSVAARAELETA